MIVKLAQWGSVVIFLMTIVFHILVILKIIPYKLVWGGRLKSDKDMYRFEIVSLILNVFFLLVVCVRCEFIAIAINVNILRIILWIMAALFLLNTIGNLLSKNRNEKVIFTPITLLLTLFSIILAVVS
ncbi:MAG: hypothetical protein SFY56_08085 [Bacteroidota bacterium]|nr:hypothetical protein [Bacteroidota bacterium]